MEGNVVGYATGMVRSEEIDESTEEICEATDHKEVIRITQVKRSLYYGLAFPFSMLADAHDPVLDGKTLPEFVPGRNDEP